jgi:hypothetical protein
MDIFCSAAEAQRFFNSIDGSQVIERIEELLDDDDAIEWSQATFGPESNQRRFRASIEIGDLEGDFIAVCKSHRSEMGLALELLFTTEFDNQENEENSEFQDGENDVEEFDTTADELLLDLDNVNLFNPESTRTPQWTSREMNHDDGDAEDWREAAYAELKRLEIDLGERELRIFDEEELSDCCGARIIRTSEGIETCAFCKESSSEIMGSRNSCHFCGTTTIDDDFCCTECGQPSF